jgi:hypothetical protein
MLLVISDGKRIRCAQGRMMNIRAGYMGSEVS